MGREGGGGESKEEEGGRGRRNYSLYYKRGGAYIANRKFTIVKAIVLFLPNVISTNSLKDLIAPKKILARSL